MFGWVLSGLMFGAVSLVVAVPMLVTVYVVTFASLGGGRSARPGGLRWRWQLAPRPWGSSASPAASTGRSASGRKPTRGPLLGIFFTGPGGFALGGLAGALWWRLVKHGANRNGS